jgi:copper chaperone CopZ
MRRSSTIVVSLLCSLLLTTVAAAATTSHTFAMTKWECAGCAKKTVRALKQIDGVSKVATDLEKKELVVTYDEDKVTVATLEAALKRLKFGCD